MPCFDILFLILLSASTPLALLTPPSPEPLPSPSPPGLLSHVPGYWGNDTTGGEAHWLPGQPVPTNDVVFSWCRESAGGCDRAALKHGRCYDLSMLDGSIRARLNSVGASGGWCMLFQHYDCSGEHTATFTGRKHGTGTLCAHDRVEWDRQANAVRCCADEGGRWCNVAVKRPNRCERV